MKELTDFLDKYNVKYNLISDCVEVEGSLDLSNNSLTSLPESFGNLKIGGHLDLSHNSLTSLPESFREIVIGGYLCLSHNSLTSLPESFREIVIGEFKFFARIPPFQASDRFSIYHNLKV